MNEQGTIFEVDDAIILLLGAPSTVSSLDGRLEGVTRLEKLMFLLERETVFEALLSEEMDFAAHNFGPFSSKIYQALNVLAAADLIVDSSKASKSNDDTWEARELIGRPVEDPYATRDIELTDRGRRYYKALISELPPDVEAEISQFKQRFASLPLRQLVRYVYKSYPTFTEKSLIKDDIFP